MDFFEAQAHAKKRTTRLVWLFAFAVAGTIALSYFAAVFGYNAVQGSRPYSPRFVRRSYYNRSDTVAADSTLWQPRVFFAVAAGTLLVVGLASLYKWNEYSAGGGAVAEGVGGRRVDPHTTDLAERRLLNVVEEMAIASGIPVPAVYLLDGEPGINAFAAGLTTSDATVCVTQGAMQKLTRDELQGVIGHEFSHILNGDMRLNLRIAAIVFGILVIGLAGRGVLWSLRGVRLRGKNSGGVLAAIVVTGLALMIIGYIGYFFGRLIQAAVSRQREFLADASAVQFTRNPAGVTGALKKIGGYAIGSTLETHKAAAIGHFFFAQAFESQFGGLWATHPPLDERIRAIDPQFDGKMFAPREVVDVAHESFVAAGLAPAPVKPKPDFTAALSAPLAAVAAIGTLTSAQISNAQGLLEGIPDRLRSAASAPAEAPVVLYGLLLDEHDAAVRERQRGLVATHAGADALRLLDELAAPLATLGPEHKLPLLQLALPALRQIPPAALEPFLDTLDELVHADGQVSPFEFALQKLLTRTLELGRTPGAAVVQLYSFNAVTPAISTVLSALARTSSDDEAAARNAFAAGAAQIKLIEHELEFLAESACDFAALDGALDQLATASPVIKQRTLAAAAHVVGADGVILIEEAELLRAISAALDVPMPPLAAAA